MTKKTSVCGICKAVNTRAHCENEQCEWSRCDECGAYGDDRNFVKKPKP